MSHWHDDEPGCTCDEDVDPATVTLPLPPQPDAQRYRLAPVTAARPGEPWRIGTSWGIHVYQGEKGSPGERPVATFHDPADARRCVDAVNGAEWGGGELREVTRKMANVLVMRMGIRFEDAWPLAVEQALHAEDYAERQARERAAEIIARVKAVPTYTLTNDDEPLGTVVLADDVLAALTADDRPAT